METTEDPSADMPSSEGNEGTSPSAEVADVPPQNLESEDSAEGNSDDQLAEDIQDEPGYQAEPSSELTQSSSVLTTSLAFSQSTPLLARILLPLLCLGCHALFYYGQTAPMWKLRTYAEIDAWANATDVSAVIL